MSRFQQFEDNVLGQKIEVSDATNIYQCMDLGYLWTFVLGFPKATISHLYAYEAFTKATDLTRQYFDVIPNTDTFVPQAGDLGIFGTEIGVAGHIVVCTGIGDTSKFKSIDANWGGKSAVQEVWHTYGGKNGFLGVLRPRPEMMDSCLIASNDAGSKLFEKLVHNSGLADAIVQKLELADKADSVTQDTIEKSLAARDGKLTTCTTALNTQASELAKAQTEIQNRIEQVGRLQDEATKTAATHLAEITALKSTMPDVEKLITTYTAQIEQLKSDLKEEAKSKGTALNEVASLKAQLEAAQKGVIASLTFAQWLSLIRLVKWNTK